MTVLAKFLRSVNDILTTLLLWTYFLFGYIIFFSPFYILTTFFSKNRERSFQALNHFFYKGFFLWARFFLCDMVVSIILISSMVSLSK